VHQYLEFAGRHWELVTALAIVVILIVADELHRRARSMHELEPAAAVALVNRGALVADCRTNEEYARGHITGARHIPLAEIAERSRELKRKGKRPRPVLAVGASSRDGAQAAALLRKAGIDTVFVLKGGVAAWRKDNLPLERTE